MGDAWDDDWMGKGENSTKGQAPLTSSGKISKAERRRQQAEFNRQIWDRENTERPEDNYFLQSRGVVPLKSDFKPQMKVLSRKPASSSNGADGSKAMQDLSIEDDDDDDEENKKTTMTPEQRMEKAQRERDEKQKAYEERRRQLFGSDGVKSSPSKSNSKNGSPRNQSRVKASTDSRPSSAASNKARQLFDPSESIKPDHLRPQMKSAPSTENQPIREPRAPDGSGRGGFGFASRGGHTT